MHVLFVTGEYPPMEGGVGAYTAELGRALLSHGVQVSILTDTRARGAASSAGHPRVYPSIRRWDWRMIGAVVGYARSLEADWLHVQYQTAAYAMHPAINLAPVVWRWAGFQVAWTYHDLRVPYLFPKAGARLRRWVTERPAFSADLTIVTNEEDRRQLADRAPSLAKIPIGSNIRARHPTPGQRRERRALRGYRDTDLVLGYFGFLNPSKGGETLVQALAHLIAAGTNARLLLIGARVGASDPTNHAYLQKVEARIERLGLTPFVQWTGRQPEAEVAADLNAVDVLLLPYVDGASLRRGTLMAGLANGCAIVTTHPRGPLPELREGRDYLAVPAEDPAAAAAAVQRIAENPGLAARLRGQARAVSRLFTWQSIAAAHHRLYTWQGHS